MDALSAASDVGRAVLRVTAPEVVASTKEGDGDASGLAEAKIAALETETVS